MSPRKTRLEAIASLCAEPAPDDGIDPRLERRHVMRRGTTRKSQQLARQIEHAVALELAESHDSVLRDLQIVSVTPDPDDRRFLVQTTTYSAIASIDRIEAIDALVRATAPMRRAVAESIHRKRAPEIAFDFVPPRTPPPEETER